MHSHRATRRSNDSSLITAACAIVSIQAEDGSLAPGDYEQLVQMKSFPSEVARRMIETPEKLLVFPPRKGAIARVYEDNVANRFVLVNSPEPKTFVGTPSLRSTASCLQAARALLDRCRHKIVKAEHYKLTLEILQSYIDGVQNDWLFHGGGANETYVKLLNISHMPVPEDKKEDVEGMYATVRQLITEAMRAQVKETRKTPSHATLPNTFLEPFMSLAKLSGCPDAYVSTWSDFVAHSSLVCNTLVEQRHMDSVLNYVVNNVPDGTGRVRLGIENINPKQTPYELTGHVCINPQFGVRPLSAMLWYRFLPHVQKNKTFAEELRELLNTGALPDFVAFTDALKAGAEPPLVTNWNVFAGTTDLNLPKAVAHLFKSTCAKRIAAKLEEREDRDAVMAHWLAEEPSSVTAAARIPPLETSF